MEHFRTEFPIEEAKLKLNYSHRIFCMGSCFTESIGAYLVGYKFKTFINPFGIVYNPLSIHNQMQMLLTDKIFKREDLFFHNEVWNSFFHHGKFSHPDAEMALENINNTLDRARKELMRTDLLIVTLGTAWVYEFLKTSQVVSNCHKVPEKEFRRFQLSVDKIADTLGTTLNQLKKLNPKLQVLFTISPVRHMKDGAAENQLSKATLLVAVHKMIRQCNYAHYFPAYEIMMDDLRDYRFYEADMVHPSSIAIEYIWEKFYKAYIDKRAFMVMMQIEEIDAARNHRPRNPHSEAHKAFLKKALVKIMQLKAAYPDLDFEQEIAYFNADSKEQVY
ncbi:MAG: GSCFA domain-containing protein [Chitinophagales bacterium]|nr:GSCFA domain-containing protein [Chitinophagales bacterium]